MRSPFPKVWRRARRRLSPTPVPFIYSRDYQLDLSGVSYDPRRGERVLAFLDAAGLLDPADVHRADLVPFRHQDFGQLVAIGFDVHDSHPARH